MADAVVDFSSFVSDAQTGSCRLRLVVEGIHCPGCAMKIEKAMNAKEGVNARVNMTSRQLTLVWDGGRERGNDLLDEAAKLGFRFSPVSGQLRDSAKEDEKHLLRCMAIAGFGAGNIMIFSLALWFSSRDSMGGATQDLFHWFCALIALPTVVYAGQPFFRSAWSALRHFRTNMDVPISVGVILATGMSLYETVGHGAYVYFDSAVMLLFLLLAGRYLDRQARGRARAAAENILSLNDGTTTVLEDGGQRRIPAGEIDEGMTLLICCGERILADGVVKEGESDVDTSALTGETKPHPAGAGSILLAGMVNLGNPLKMTVSKTPVESLAGEIVALMQKAEQGNASYVRIADKVAGYYTPVVHLLALGAFLFWSAGMGLAWQPSLMIAVTVLIITCPCALGLAVPVVQVLASQWLFRRGILVKTADAFERLARTDTVVFDKTGTLTAGDMALARETVADDALQLAASLAIHSGHPLSRAIVKSWKGSLLPLGNVTETKGAGLSGVYDGQTVLLGSRQFCGIDGAVTDGLQETWLVRGHNAGQRMAFRDSLRQDAAETVGLLQRAGLRVLMLSGDRQAAAAGTAAALGIAEYKSEVNPKQKLEIVGDLMDSGRQVLMVGDGINDAPALLRAGCSMSPASAMQVTQNAASFVFQGESLKAVATALKAARLSQRLVYQNFTLAVAYNIIAVPLALSGQVTPLIAAVAMSCSSLAVTLNALRLNNLKDV